MVRRKKTKLPVALIKAFLPTPRKRPRRKASAVSRVKAPRTALTGTWTHGRFTGAAGSRSYRVYVPRGIRTAKAPLLVALHGCRQDGLDFATGTRFNDLADRQRFVVVYPEQSSIHNVQRCWNWFRPAHQNRSAGEPAILSGIIHKVAQEASRWRIDRSRIYVAGISAGGAMALILAATYPELFAAVGVHSAPPYRSASGPLQALAAMLGASTPPEQKDAPPGPMPPMVIFQGTADGTVRPINAQRVAEQWLACRTRPAAGGPISRAGATTPVGPPRAGATAPVRPVTTRSRRGYRVDRWYAGGRKVLEVWLVEGLGHAWSGGALDGSYSDPRGPRASTEMWKFFAPHRSTTSAAVIGG